MLRKCLLLTCCLLLCIFSAQALEISCTELTPFSDNIITVRCDQPGKLTLHVQHGELPLMDACTALEVESGQTDIPYDALSWNEEPLPRGPLTLTAVLTQPDGEEVQTQITCQVNRPRPAVTYCVVERNHTQPGVGKGLRIDCGLSNTGRVELAVFAPDDPDTPLWKKTVSVSAAENGTAYWKGVDQKGHPLPLGEYILRAWCERTPDRIIEQTLYLDDTAPLEELFETGELMPADLNDDQLVWEAFCQPVVVLTGTEGQGDFIYEKMSYNSNQLGSVQSRSTCIKVLDLSDSRWAHVGAWRQQDGVYIEGYVLKSKLQVIEPNPQYGLLLDKNRQVIRVYEDGVCLGEMPISTGSLVNGPRSETQPGVHLTVNRQHTFMDENNYTYHYALRFDGPNMIHELGYHMRGGVRDYSDQFATLGQKASHGCVRVDCRILPPSNGLNAYWLWTHISRNTKVIIVE